MEFRGAVAVGGGHPAGTVSKRTCVHCVEKQLCFTGVVSYKSRVHVCGKQLPRAILSCVKSRFRTDNRTGKVAGGRGTPSWQTRPDPTSSMCL